MKKTSAKPNLLVELTERKMAAQKSGEAKKPFSQLKPKKKRNENNSSVGPSWGARKGN